jgi:hypothetical protein
MEPFDIPEQFEIVTSFNPAHLTRAEKRQGVTVSAPHKALACLDILGASATSLLVDTPPAGYYLPVRPGDMAVSVEWGGIATDASLSPKQIAALSLVGEQSILAESGQAELTRALLMDSLARLCRGPHERSRNELQKIVTAGLLLAAIEGVGILMLQGLANWCSVTETRRHGKPDAVVTCGQLTGKNSEGGRVVWRRKHPECA